MNTINSYTNTDTFKWTAAILGAGALAYTGYRVYSTIYDLNQRNQALETTNRTLQDRTDTLTTQLHTSEAAKRTLQDRLANATTLSNTLQRDLNTSRTENGILLGRIANLTTLSSTLQTALTTSRTENATLQERVTNLTEQNRADRVALSETREKSIEQQKRIEGLVSKVKKAEKTTLAKDKALGGVLVNSLAYQKAVKESKSNNTILSGTISHQRSINRENQETIQTLRKENQAHLEKIVQLQKRQAFDSLKISWLGSKIDQLQNVELVPIVQLPTDTQQQKSKTPLLGVRVGWIQFSVSSSPVEHVLDNLLETAAFTSHHPHASNSANAAAATAKPWVQLTSSVPTKVANAIFRT